MAQRKKLVHIHSNVYRNGAPQAPANGVLEKGEIAVNYNDTEPALFIENNSGGIVKFNAIQRSEITQLQDDVEGLGTSISTVGNAKIKLNGVDKAVSGNSISFYAPTASGAANTVLVSSGANQSPTWVAQSSLSVGNASQAGKTVGTLTINSKTGFNGSADTTINLTYEDVGAASESHTHTSADLPKATTGATGVMQVGDFLTVTTAGKVSVATGTSSTTIAKGDHTHNYAGSASAGGAANSTKGTLTLKNATGGTIATFNGSADSAVTLNYETVGAAEAEHTHTSSDLPKATTGTTGIVQVGSFLSIDSNSKLSVATGTSSTTVARGDHSHSYAGSASAGGPANSTKGKLTIKNGAGSAVTEFSGSADASVTINSDFVGAAPAEHNHTSAELPKATTGATGVMQVGSFLSVDTNSKVSVATGTSSTTVARGDHSHSYAGSASVGGPANSVKGKLTIKNGAGSAVTEYSGSTDASITINADFVGAAPANHQHTSAELPKATTGGTGVMQVGSFLSVDTNGKVSVATGTSNTTVAVGSHTHNYAGSASAGGAANSTKGTLTIKNYSGGTIADFNGSTTTAITLTHETVGAAAADHQHTAAELPKATTGSTGVMEVGSFLTVNADGRVSVATGTTNATVAVGNHTHLYAGSASAGGAANSTKGTLTLKNATGGTIASFNGSADSAVTLTYETVGAAQANHVHTTAELPMDTNTSLSDSTDKLPSSKMVKSYVDGLVASPVNYKGAITTGAVPSSSKVGDMYIVQTSAISLTSATSATGAAQTAEVGDYIICRSTGKWDVVQKNLTGAVTSSVNLTTDKFVLGNANNQTIKTSAYGPSSFAEASHTHTSADLPKATTGGTGVMQVGSFLSVDSNSKVSVATGTSSTTVARGDHSHNYAGSSSAGGAANSTKGTLTLKNSSGTTVAEFNGSTTTALTLNCGVVGAAEAAHTHTSADLPKATTGATGVMQVGSFLSVDANSKVSVATGTSSTTVARGDHSHSYAGSASAGGAANSTKGTLTLKNSTGGTIASFNGSADSAITLNCGTVGAAEATHTHTSADLPKATTGGTGVMQVGSFLSVDSNGKVAVSTGTSSTTVARGDHSHSYAGSSSVGGAANSVKGTLTLKNNAGTTIATYNGSADSAVTLTYAVVGAAPESHTHTGGQITSAVANATNADKVDGYHLSVVTTMPTSPDANTIYILK